MPGKRRSSRVTDFPSEDDRPSLPVTPAPIHRRGFWGRGDSNSQPTDDEEDEVEREGRYLPAAEGVPLQSEWDPVAQLQKLAQQQSEVLQRLGGGAMGGDGRGGGVGRGAAGGVRRGSPPRENPKEIPSRSLPFGSEDVKSPTYVAQQKQLQMAREKQQQQQQQQQEGGSVLSPTPLKPASGTMSVRGIVEAGSVMAAPSYGGPGPQFEKGEGVTASDHIQTLPTDNLQREVELFDD